MSSIVYMAVLLVLAGLFVLFVDVKEYRKNKQGKEKKVAKFLGWFNVIAGVIVFISNWVYHQWIW